MCFCVEINVFSKLLASARSSNVLGYYINIGSEHWGMACWPQLGALLIFFTLSPMYHIGLRYQIFVHNKKWNIHITSFFLISVTILTIQTSAISGALIPNFYHAPDVTYPYDSQKLHFSGLELIVVINITISAIYIFVICCYIFLQNYKYVV